MSTPLVKLGSVVRQRKEFVLIDDLSRYNRVKVQLHSGGLVLRDSVMGNEIRTKRQQVCREGELLVAEIDAKVGGYGLVPGELDGAIVSSHYFLYEVDYSRIDREYLGLLLQSKHFLSQVTSRGSTNYAAIRPDEVLEYLIPLPMTLAEQRREAALINDFRRSKLEVSRLLPDYQARRKLYQAGLRQSMSSITGDPEALDSAMGVARKRHSGLVTDRSNGATPGHFVERDGLFDLPHGWRWLELGALCSHIVDCVNDTPTFVEERSPYFAIKSTNVRPNNLELQDTWHVPEADWRLWNRRLTPQVDDILITREAPMGNVCRIPAGLDLCLTQRTVCLRADSDFVSPAFLTHVLNDRMLLDQAFSISRSSPPHIRVRDIPLLLVPVCDRASQERLVDAADAIYRISGDISSLADEVEVLVSAASAKSVDAMFSAAS